MTKESKEIIVNHLKSLDLGEMVTIEEIVRNLGRKNGDPFTVFEVQYYETIENYLLKEGLIADTGKTTKLYRISSKSKTS